MGKMFKSTIFNTNLASITPTSIDTNSKLHKTTIINICLAIIFLFACAQVSIPLNPVPITLQPLGVIFLGLICSGKITTRSIFIYILLGISGVPVFANFSSGLGIILGPRGGYILGFLASAYVLSILNERWQSYSWLSIFIKSLIGTIIIYTFGIFGLLNYLGGDLIKAIQFGVLPFIIPGIIKSMVLVFLLKGVGYSPNKNNIYKKDH